MKIFQKIIFALSVAALVFVGCSMSTATSAADGNAKDATIKKNVKIGNFNKIDAATGIKVIYSQGKATGIAKVATTPSAEKYLKIYVKNGELVIRYVNHVDKNIKGPTIVTVTSPQLDEVDVSSAARFMVNGNLDVSNKFEIEVSSAAKASFNNITAKSVDIELSSSASVDIATINADKVDAEMSSASKLDISKTICSSIDLYTSSAAKIMIGYFNGTKIETESSSGSTITISGITARQAYSEVSSGAKVVLKGRCEHFNKDASSGGKVDISQLEVPNLPKKTSRKHQPRNP